MGLYDDLLWLASWYDRERRERQGKALMAAFDLEPRRFLTRPGWTIHGHDEWLHPATWYEGHLKREWPPRDPPAVDGGGPRKRVHEG